MDRATFIDTYRLFRKTRPTNPEFQDQYDQDVRSLCESDQIHARYMHRVEYALARAINDRKCATEFPATAVNTRAYFCSSARSHLATAAMWRANLARLPA